MNCRRTRSGTAGETAGATNGGVYLSFPFCAQKCTYCNFASGVFPRELERRYIDAVADEIARHQWEWTPQTLYLGGGTPSRMEEPDLLRWIETIPGRPWVESTMEAAPGDVSPEQARAWYEAGINRVSFGVQSFIPRELAQTGRRHTAGIVQREVELLRSVGIVNLNLDLIAGLPFQTVESFEESLDWVIRLGVPHVSVYMLEVDEESRLGKEILMGGGRYGAGQLPSDEDIVRMYALANTKLRHAGIPRYEISNFARPGMESAHNLKYWRLEPYVGFGADAHSFDGRTRRQNAESAGEYTTRWESHADIVSERTAADLADERLMVGLRLASGIRLCDQDWLRHGAAFDRFAAQGLLERNGDILRLTDQGVLFSNEVFEEFVTA